MNGDEEVPIDLFSLEEQLQAGHMRRDRDTQSQPAPIQNLTFPDLSPEDEALAKKFKEIESHHRDIQTREAADILKGHLGEQEFRELFIVCKLGSKVRDPNGYHLAYTGKGKVAINPEIIPIHIALDMLGGDVTSCYHHLGGLVTGATASRKPYEILHFNPSEELQSIIKDVPEYRVVTSNVHRMYQDAGLKRNRVTAVIFEDENFGDLATRELVVSNLQEADEAIRMCKEGQISRQDLTRTIRKLRDRKLPAEVVTERPSVEKPQPPTKENGQGMTYGLPYKPVLVQYEDMNLFLRRFKVPYELLPTEREGVYDVHVLDSLEVTPEEIEQAAENVKWLDETIGTLRVKGVRERKEAELYGRLVGFLAPYQR